MASLITRLTALLIAFSMFRLTLAIPLVDKLRRLTPGARDILKRTTPAAPQFVVYHDAWTHTFPSAAQLQGFSVYMLAFWMTTGPADMALAWQEFTASERASYLQEYNAAGISLIVSAFGSTDAPTTLGTDAVTIADSLATWVLEYSVQGVDVDYEDFIAFNYGEGSAESWLISFTQQLRTYLPQGEYILSHAPVAPWFSSALWSGGGYLAVHTSVGSLIDWYNVQFYNQGTSEYTTCSGLLTASSVAWPKSALFQIAANGVPLDKLVIGKPGTIADANGGYMSASTLASCVAQAQASGWNAGVMVWEYPHVGSAWITAVRGNTWPVSGSSPPVTPLPTPTTTPTIIAPQPTTPTSTIAAPPPTVSTPTIPEPQPTSSTITIPAQQPTTSTTSTTLPTPTTTTLSGIGNCAGISPWTDNLVYVGGDHVTYNGDLWVANWWNEDEAPGGESGVWSDDGAC